MSFWATPVMLRETFAGAWGIVYSAMLWVKLECRQSLNLLYYLSRLSKS